MFDTNRDLRNYNLDIDQCHARVKLIKNEDNSNQLNATSHSQSITSSVYSESRKSSLKCSTLLVGVKHLIVC